jgi:hypothetical protein
MAISRHKDKNPMTIRNENKNNPRNCASKEHQTKYRYSIYLAYNKR